MIEKWKSNIVIQRLHADFCHFFPFQDFCIRHLSREIYQVMKNRASNEVVKAKLEHEKNGSQNLHREGVPNGPGRLGLNPVIA